jgi:iron(III) transport system substrate-binding protein
MIRVFCVVAVAVALSGCRNSRQNSVTVYVSEDQVFSEPILKDFERESGIKVNAVFDTEEAKSTGVMNKLLAEKGNPQADVYWANEPVRADVLRQQGVSTPFRPANAAQIPDQFKEPQGFWTGFSARARLLVVNKNAKTKPGSILAYLDPKAKGKAVIANPLFGTTTAQMAPQSPYGAMRKETVFWTPSRRIKSNSRRAMERAPILSLPGSSNSRLWTAMTR